jgi:NAD(P)-dependent dehydrogenase (short-subunit alcohol dehydrogenase family)
MASNSRPLAVVTGASTGIGYELAKCCAREGFYPVVAADEPEIRKAAEDFEALGAKVEALEAGLAMRGCRQSPRKDRQPPRWTP